MIGYLRALATLQSRGSMFGSFREHSLSASGSCHPPDPKMLGHFRRGRARPFGTAAAAKAGIPRLRRRRPRWSRGSDLALRDGGPSCSGGGGRDPVSLAGPAWQAGLGVRSNAGPSDRVWKPKRER